MSSGNKTISNSLRPRIDATKCIIRYSTRPFDGTGYVFKQAIRELRAEGVNIVHQKEKCNYIIIKT